MAVVASGPPGNPIDAQSHLVLWSKRLARDALGASDALAGQLRSAVALVGEISRDYGDRFLLELLQNSYDAEPRDGQGVVQIKLDLDEGAFGTLYVANSGRPFSTEDLRGICEMGQSPKLPGQGIGNKGVGFRSVLQVCDFPEIYSRSGRGIESFDGFCFSFARPADFLVLAGGDTTKARELASRLSPYALPVPLGDGRDHASISRFAASGASTLVRLELRDSAARERTIRQLRDLKDEVSTLVFLDRIRSVIIEETSNGETTGTGFAREPHSTRVEGDVTVSEVEMRFEEVRLEGDLWVTEIEVRPAARYLLASRVIDGDRFRSAIAESVSAKSLDTKWLDWEDEARVEVALGLDQPEVDGRLFAFLPMAAEEKSPFAGHLNAPFAVRLARDRLVAGVALNEFLFDQAADLCVTLAETLRADPSGRTLVPDLITWKRQHVARLVAAIERSGSSPKDLAIVPVLGGRWSSLEESYRWDDSGLGVITADRVSVATGAPLVDPDIGSGRVTRLQEFHQEILRLAMEPPIESKAAWVEDVAASLQISLNGQPDGGAETWLGFYDDLATIFDSESGALAGRRLVLDDEYKLQRCWQLGAGSQAVADGPAMFFHASTDEDPDEVDAPAGVAIPRTLRKHLGFTHGALKWKAFNEDTRRFENRRGREFLERRRLVRLPRRQELFTHVRNVLATSRSDATFREALQFVYRASRASRPYTQDPALSALNLRVPTGAGWVSAASARLGRAWSQEVEAAWLEEFIERASSTSEDVRSLGERLVVGPDEWPFRVSAEHWREFLRTIGVRDGLWPEPRPRVTIQASIRDLTPGFVGARLGFNEEFIDLWIKDVARDGGSPTYLTGQYESASQICRIPGQDALDQLPERARLLFGQLIVRGLGQWPEEMLRLTFTRMRSGSPDEHSWPSPLATFLRDAKWVPVTRPGEPGATDLVRPARAWHFREDGDPTPVFVPLLPAAIRRMVELSSVRAARMVRLGLRTWNEGKTALGRLFVLGHRFARGVPDAQLQGFRKAYERAWDDVIENGLVPNWSPITFPPLLVSRRGQLTALRPTASPDTPSQLVLLREENATIERLLASLEVPALCVDPHHGAAVGALLEGRFPGSVRIVGAHDFDIRLDGKLIIDGEESRPLVATGNAWLSDLLALTLELKSTQFNRQSERTVREAVERLRAIRIQHGDRISITFDGEEVTLPESLHGVLPLTSSLSPTIVLQRPEASIGWTDLQRMASAIAELVDQPLAAPALELCLRKLADRRAGSDLYAPIDEDYAAVFGESVDRIREIRRGHLSILDDLVYLLRPFLAYFLGTDVAELLLDASKQQLTEARLREALLPYRGKLGGDPTTDLIDLARSKGDLAEMRDSLKLDYREFNRCLVENGYQPYLNREGHASAFAAFLQLNRGPVLDALRGAFLSAFDDGEDLPPYVSVKLEYLDAARGDAGAPSNGNVALRPDPRWLEDSYLPSVERMTEQVNDWLSSVGTELTGATQLGLMAIDEARALNERVARAFARSAERCVPAWCRKHAAECPTIWSDQDPAGALVERLNAAGRMDFRTLETAELLRWLTGHDLWPVDMPATLDLDVLDLVEADLSARDDQLAQDRRRRELARRSIEFEGKAYTLDQDSVAALAADVLSGLSSELLATSSRFAQLAKPGASSRSRMPGGGRGSPGAKPQRLTDPQRELIGFVGELVAFEWLKAKYGATPECWRSRNRRFLFSDDEGRDDLGYDLEIARATGSLLFEVKARGHEDRFSIELSESELRVAQEQARNRRYRIIYVSNVLDPSLRRLIVLPNPRSNAGRDFYHVTGTGIRYQFQLEGGTR